VTRVREADPRVSNVFTEISTYKQQTKRAESLAADPYKGLQQ